MQVICMKKEDFLHSPYVAKHGSVVDLTHIFVLVGDPSASQAIRRHGAGGVDVRVPVQPPHKGKHVRHCREPDLREAWPLFPILSAQPTTSPPQPSSRAVECLESPRPESQ